MKYLIEGKKQFKGAIMLEYNEMGHLIALRIDGPMTEAQHEWFFKYVPRLEELISVYRSSGVFKVTKVIDEITFDDFYAEYGNKVGKQKALKAWNRLPRSEQLKAYAYIGRYKYHVATTGIAQAYPATYLNQQRWND